MLNPDKLNDLRKRVLAGEEYTDEELAFHVQQLIADRVNAFQEANKKKAPKGKSTPVDLNDLL